MIQFVKLVFQIQHVLLAAILYIYMEIHVNLIAPPIQINTFKTMEHMFANLVSSLVVNVTLMWIDARVVTLLIFTLKTVLTKLAF